MNDKNNDVFEYDPASFWKNTPYYQPTPYVPVVNQDTGEVVIVNAERLKTNSKEQIIQQVDKFYARLNFFRKNLKPELVQQIAQWVREESNLLHLVATQLCFHLVNVYDYLLKLGLENGQLFDKGFPHFLLILDKEHHPINIKLNLSEAGVEEVISYLEESIKSRFETSDIWTSCAKSILSYQAVSATEKMEDELGEKAVDEMSAESWQDNFYKYIHEQSSTSSLEEQLNALVRRFSDEIVQVIIKGLDLPNISLAELDKILGLSLDDATQSIPVTESRLTDATLAVPTFAAFASAITAQTRKDLWRKDASGLACFQHQAKGNPNNYIEHYITSPGDIAVLPWNQAEQIIDKFGFNTVKLHLIFAAHTMNQPVPWEGKFSLKASDVVKYLGWDKRTDLPVHEKLNEIAKAAFVLDCLLVKSVWVEGRNKKGGINASTPTGRMWSVVVDPRGQLNLEGKVEKPEEVYITVQPGLIFQSFLNKAGSRLKEALYQFGYLAQDILRIDPYHDELALRLAIHLTMDSRIHAIGKYRVATLLEAMLPHTVIDAARSNKHKAYDLKQRWDNALKLLLQLRWQIQFDETYPEWLQPGGNNAPKPEDWRKMKIIDWLLQAKLTINPPEPIPELLIAKVVPKPKAQKKLQPAATITKLTGNQIRKAREAKGWTQRKLAGWLGVSDVLIGYWEKGKRTPSGDMEIKLREILQIHD
jgi:DNA-binding transcriptional regulator YiaG